jgi:hypothetical protein
MEIARAVFQKDSLYARCSPIALQRYELKVIKLHPTATF